MSPVSGARRLIGEGLVILLSILAAFALDSWWAERVERRALLQDLLGDPRRGRNQPGRLRRGRPSGADPCLAEGSGRGDLILVRNFAEEVKRRLGG